MLYVCKEHLEDAIDEIVDNFEKAPEILTMEQAGLADEVPKKACCSCEHDADYTLEWNVEEVV